MPVIPEDIWMRILQISDEEAFWIDRAPRAETGIDWSRDHPTAFAKTYLKPVSAEFSVVCSRWREVVRNTGARWVTTVNSGIKTPLPVNDLENALRRCSTCDIDIYIHNSEKLNLIAPPPSTPSNVHDLFRHLMGYSPRWRSLLVARWDHKDISNVIDGLNMMEEANRLVALDIILCGPHDVPLLRNNSLLNSRFPALCQLQIDSSRISLGPLASFPRILHLSMNILNVKVEDLLRAVSDSAVVKRLMITSYAVGRRQEIRPVIMGRVPQGLQLTLPYLTDLEIYVGTFDVLPFLRCAELPCLTSLKVNTGNNEEEDTDLISPPDEREIILHSLISLQIYGWTSKRKLLSLISHMSMPCLKKLTIRPGSFDATSDSTPVPVITLPSLQSMTLYRVTSAGGLGVILDTPKLGTLIVIADEDTQWSSTFCPIHGHSAMSESFPLLHTLEMRDYTLTEVDEFLLYHNLPSLKVLVVEEEMVYPPLNSPMWVKFFERQQGLLAKLEQFYVHLQLPRLASPPGRSS